MDTLELHRTIGQDGPYDPTLGSALITLVEPHEGWDREYNRWYEDDHFISGALAMPWMFAGRRFVAPKPLQALRAPAGSPIADPLDRGKYISLYWIIDGRQEEHAAHSTAINRRLRADGRVEFRRDHVFTSFQRYLGSAYRDSAVPRDVHVLNYPFQGLILEVIDAHAGKRDELLDWLRTDYLPSRLGGEDLAVAMLFAPLPLPADKMPDVADIPGLENRITVLWFCDGTPEAPYARAFGDAASDIAEGGAGELALVAAFIPTFPGTDCYVDQLR